MRNVTDRFTNAVASAVAKRMWTASRDPHPLVAQADLEALVRELDRSGPGAAGSLRKAWPRPYDRSARRATHPARTLGTTNPIASMIASFRDHAANTRALARRADGAALGRRRPGPGTPAVPPRQPLPRLPALRAALDQTVAAVTPTKEDAA